MPNRVPRRGPLSDFLRTCRAERGLSAAALLRKIYMATGVALSLYNYYRIERDRRRPSADALDNIADGLECNPAEREYAFSLIPQKPPPMISRATVPDSVRRLVALQQNMSAHVIDRRMGIVASNDIFAELYGFDLDAIDERDRNIAWLMFSHPNVSQRLRDWEIHAQTVVALCRSLWARYERDNEIREIRHRMMTTFPQFAKWWNQPRVSTGYFRKEIDHPDVGTLVLEQTVHRVLTCQDLYLVLLAPLPEHDTEQKLSILRAQRSD